MTGLAAAGTLLFDGNYMFLREPPEDGSLLDLMGPWPWYIASAAALALVLFWLLDRPFDGRPEAPLEWRTTRSRVVPMTPTSALAERLDAGHEGRDEVRATSCASARSAAPARR